MWGVFYWYKKSALHVAGHALHFYIMKQFVDAHCHYNADAFAYYAGAGHFICNAVDAGDWETLLLASRRNPHIHIALGLHPWYVADAAPNWANDLRRILIENQTAMVGEIGLDASRDNMPAQYDAFVMQYRMAADLSRTAHIHCVHAWDKMLHVFKTLLIPPAVVAHRFSGNLQILSSAINISDHIYFSYRDADIKRMRDIIAATPHTRILVETDGRAPDGEQINAAISKIAQIHGKSVTDMSDIIYNNSLRVINNGQIA